VPVDGDRYVGPLVAPGDYDRRVGNTKTILDVVRRNIGTLCDAPSVWPPRVLVN
jgi:hypothetical protein